MTKHKISCIPDDLKGLKLPSTFCNLFLKSRYEPSNSSCIETLTSMLNCKKCWPSVRKIHELDLCYDTCKVMVGNSACFDDGVFESYSGFE